MSAHGPVLVVDDHELLLETLRVALTSEGVSCEILAPSSTSDVLDTVDRCGPRLTLLDLDLGSGVDDGSTLVTSIRRRGSDVLVVTGSLDPGPVAAAVDAGALGYLPKSASFDRLLDAVMRALEGLPVLSDHERWEFRARVRAYTAERTSRLAPFDRLTVREGEVLRALADGVGVDEIASRAVVSPSTVRTQVRGILTKLGVRTQLAAVASARQAGWLDEPVR